MLSVVRRLVVSGQTTVRRGEEAIDDLFALPIERYPTDVLVRRAWDHKDYCSAYDATCLAPAEVLAPEAPPILTADAPFARAARAHTAVPIILAAAGRAPR